MVGTLQSKDDASQWPSEAYHWREASEFKAHIKKLERDLDYGISLEEASSNLKTHPWVDEPQVYLPHSYFIYLLIKFC